jgi:hypothetical protein
MLFIKPPRLLLWGPTLKTPEKLSIKIPSMPFSRWKTEGTLALLEGKLTKGLLFMSVKINHVNAHH